MTCIIVLGMHRSGTSCLTGILQGCGVELGEVFTCNPHNQRGNRENARIMILNDAILAHNGGAWNDPVDVQNWTAEHIIERDEIINELASGGAKHWGFKDPRTLLTLPFWLEAVQPQLIGTFRYPMSVAMSLQQRDHMTLDEAFLLWHDYNRRLIDYWQKFNFPLINFDLEANDYLTDIVRKLAGIGLDRLKIDSALSFYDKGLLHQNNMELTREKLPGEIAEMYQRLVACSEIY